MGVVIGKGKAIAIAIAGVVDGVAQAAGLTHNGDGAITAGYHLGQAAGFGAGRHQEDIGTGINALGQLGVKANVHANAAGVAGAQLVEEVLVLGFAGAEDHQLNALLQQAFGNAAHQVNALVTDQTGDHGHDRAAILVQAELILQSCFADGLALLHRVSIIVLRDIRVGGGVENIHVNTVQDTAQLILLLAQQAIQTMAEPRVQDLLCIGRADGGDLISSLDCALHKVGAAIILHNVGIACANAAGILQDIHAILALVGNVMDGEYCLDVVELIQVAVVQVEVNRGKGGLPVVAVDDIRLKVGIEQGFQNGAGEESKTLAVIIEAIQAAALKVIFVVDKVERHAVMLGLEQAAVLAAPAHGHAEIGNIGQRILELEIAVQGHDNAAVNAVMNQSLGQCTGNIGQTTGFCIRCSLAGCIENFHGYLLAEPLERLFATPAGQAVMIK